MMMNCMGNASTDTHSYAYTDNKKKVPDNHPTTQLLYNSSHVYVCVFIQQNGVLMTAKVCSKRQQQQQQHFGQ